MSNEELAKKIVDLLGGKDNILNAENCMTRIRVNVKDGPRRTARPSRTRRAFWAWWETNPTTSRWCWDRARFGT